MDNKIENLFSELVPGIDNRSLSTDAIKDKFLLLSNLLDEKFSLHLKHLAPLLKNKFDQAEKKSLIAKKKAEIIVQILKLSNDAGIMANENVLSATKGLSPKHKDEEINAILKEADKLRQTQTSDSMTFDKVMEDIINVRILSEKYYRLPQRRIRRIKFWFRFSNLFVILAKIFFFLTTILLANLFSKFLKKSFGIEGLFSELLVASIFLVTVDKLFDKIKGHFFWTRYKRFHKSFHSAYLKLCETEADFSKYERLL